MSKFGPYNSGALIQGWQCIQYSQDVSALGHHGEMDKGATHSKKKIVKRKLKNFTHALWNEALSKRDWSQIKNTKGIDNKVDIYISPCLREINNYY